MHTRQHRDPPVVPHEVEASRDKCWTDVAGGGPVGTRTAGSTCFGQGVPREASSSTSRASCWSLHRLLALPSTGKMVDASVWCWEWSRQCALSRSRRLLRQLASQQRDLLGRATLEPQTGFLGHYLHSRENREMLVIQGTPARNNTSALNAGFP